MSLKVLLVAALAVVIAGLVCLGEGMNGNINASAGWPVSAMSLRICVTSSGWWAVAGEVCTLVGTVLLVAGIVKFAFFERAK